MDAEAESTVIEAIQDIVARGERPYSHNVPSEAKGLLIKRGRGRTQPNDASNRVAEAIVALSERGELDCDTAPQVTWAIRRK